jgi:ABC-type transport system involved in multi-copper enzyme maturation permease subunit
MVQPPPSDEHPRPGGLRSALSAERVKLVRPLGWVVLAGLGAVTALAALVYRFAEQPRDPGTIHNGFGCLAYSAGIGFWVGALALVVYGSLLVVSERSWGTAAMGLLQGQRRRDFYMAKVLVLLGAVLLLFAVVSAAAWGSAAVLYGFGDVVEEIPYGSEVLHYKHHSCGSMVERSVLAFALTLPPLLGCGVLGFLCSVVLGRTATALGTAVFAYFTLEFFLKRFTDDLSDLLFNAYTDRFLETLLALARGISTAAFSGREIALSLAGSLGFAILSLVLSFIVFSRQDID